MKIEILRKIDIMKCIIFLFLVGMLYRPVFAQEVTPEKMMNSNSDIRNKIVELALQNPTLEVADREVKIAKYNLSAAKGWWAENFSFSFNANEYSLKYLGKSSTDESHVYTPYPLYNMGINIPIGGIFSKPQSVKAGRERVYIAQANRTNTYREIKAEALAAYEDYLRSQKLLAIQSQVTESVYSEYLQAQQKFSDGQITIDDYNNMVQQYRGQLITRINAEHNLNLDRIKLESIIGVPISSLLTGYTTTPNGSSDSIPSKSH
jgi:outer membrane protein TolC